MGIHRSTDCGRTWTGPFEVTAATNPNGFVAANGDPVDAADKEFIDVDRATGRLMVSWTDFTPVPSAGSKCPPLIPTMLSVEIRLPGPRVRSYPQPCPMGSLRCRASPAMVPMLSGVASFPILLHEHHRFRPLD